MIEKLINVSWDDTLLIAISTIVIFIGIITYTRILGLRSFSKMSSFDFAMTVAVGSIMGSVAVTSTSLSKGLIALGFLYLTQGVIAFLRLRTSIEKYTDNQPILLMKDGKLLQKNMAQARVTTNDVKAKLREANVLDISEVKAVVLESTGDISVLHGSKKIDPQLLDDVICNDN